MDNQLRQTHARKRQVRQREHLSNHRHNADLSCRLCAGWTALCDSTIHARHGDSIYLHGAKASRMLKHIASGESICITVTHLDGLVLARSTFHSSMNYRSAAIYGRGRLVEDEAEKLQALAMIASICAGRWEDTRQPAPQNERHQRRRNHHRKRLSQIAQRSPVMTMKITYCQSGQA